MPAPSTAAEWLTSQGLCTALRISRSTLSNLLADGVFTPGKHFYRRGRGPRAPLAFDLAACRDALLRRTAADPASFEIFVP